MIGKVMWWVRRLMLGDKGCSGEGYIIENGGCKICTRRGCH